VPNTKLRDKIGRLQIFQLPPTSQLEYFLKATIVLTNVTWSRGLVQQKNIEILFCTMGTKGDVLPFLVLCRPFLKAGHPVRFLSNRNWRDVAIAEGATFYEIAEEDPPQCDRDDLSFYRERVLPSFWRSYDFIRRHTISGRKSILIYRTGMLGAECAAEQFGLLNIKVALQPSAIRSVQRPPWPLSGLAVGRWGWLGKAAVIPALYVFGDCSSRYRKHANDFRRSIGLSRTNPGKVSTTEDLFLVLCPDWFALPQKDWPVKTRVVGFPFAEAIPGDSELIDFIATNGPPVVFTPGTGVERIDNFFDIALALTEKIGISAVFLSPALGSRFANSHSRVIAREYVDLGWLLPKARLLFHHGGIGSIAQAIRAGIPQLILPNRFDQPDNAFRVAILGLGAVALSTKLSVDDLSDLALHVLSRSDIRRQLTIGANLVHQDNPALETFVLVSNLARKRFAR
jgi:rhamnosyltransferase subunit B